MRARGEDSMAEFDPVKESEMLEKLWTAKDQARRHRAFEFERRERPSAASRLRRASTPSRRQRRGVDASTPSGQRAMRQKW